MKWTDGMRDELAKIYANRIKELGEKEFFSKFEEIKVEAHKTVEDKSCGSRTEKIQLSRKKEISNEPSS